MSIIKKIRSWIGYLDYPEGFHLADAPTYIDKDFHIRLSDLTESAKRLGLSTKDIKNINMKKSFKEQLKQLDNIINEFKDKECLTDCENEELKELRKQKSKLVKRKLDKLDKKQRKLEKCLGFKRISDLEPYTTLDDFREPITINFSAPLPHNKYVKLESEKLESDIKELINNYYNKVKGCVNEFNVITDQCFYNSEVFGDSSMIRNNVKVDYRVK